MDDRHPTDRLSAFADGELGEDADREIRFHLESCEECRRRLETLRSTQHKLAELGARREPTDALRRKIERRAEPTTYDDAGGLPLGLTWTRLAALAAALAVALGVGYYFGDLDDAQLQSDWEELLVRDHLRSQPAAKPMDVTGEDPAAAVRYFRDKVEFSPVVPRVPRARLMGGRLCKLAGEHVELLFYRHEGEVLSLFVARNLRAPELCRSSKGHSVCVRSKGDLRLMMVGRGSRKELNELLKRTQI